MATAKEDRHSELMRSFEAGCSGESFVVVVMSTFAPLNVRGNRWASSQMLGTKSWRGLPLV